MTPRSTIAPRLLKRDDILLVQALSGFLAYEPPLLKVPTIYAVPLRNHSRGGGGVDRWRLGRTWGGIHVERANSSAGHAILYGICRQLMLVSGNSQIAADEVLDTSLDKTKHHQRLKTNIL